MKYLLTGLGNIGAEYQNTRHNIGFKIADKVAEKLNAQFKTDRLVFIADSTYKGRKVYIIKPTTYMNLSGKAVQYWLNKLEIPKENLFVNVDDLNLEFGQIRIRTKGSDGGHNGLSDIQDKIGKDYGRLRVGIGNQFMLGRQVDYVLGDWNEDELIELPNILEKAANANLDFVFRGFDFILNNYSK